MRRLIQILVLVGWVGCFIWLLSGDRYMAYLRDALWPVLAGGLALGVAFLIAVLRGGAGHTHHGGGSGYLRAAICLMPLAYVFIAPSAPLGTHAFAKRFVEKPAEDTPPPPEVEQMAEVEVEPEPETAVAPEPETKAEPKPKAAPTAMTAPPELPMPTDLQEITERFDFMKGQLISVEGMVFRQPNTSAKRIVLFRFSISCCAADALPMGVYVFADGLDKFENDQWLRVEGRLLKRDVDGKMREAIEATKVTAIEQPANPYISSMDEFGMGF